MTPTAAAWAAGLLVAVTLVTLTRGVFGGDAARRALLADPVLDGPAGWLHGVSPTVKLLGALAVAIAASLTPLPRLAVPALLLIAFALSARVPLRALLARVGELAGFAVLAAIGALLAGDPARFALVVSRALLTLLALQLLVVTTPLPAVARAAGRLGVPALLVSLFTLALRYLALLLDEASRMGLAFGARAVGPRDLRLARPLGRLVGCLGVRTLERGERIHRAMLARGFDGTFPSLDAPRRVRWIELAGLLAFAAVLAGGAAWPIR